MHHIIRLGLVLGLAPTLGWSEAPTLIARWPLGAPPDDRHDVKPPVTARDLRLIPDGPGGRPATAFNGRTSVLETPAAPCLQLGRGEFTVTAWVNSAAVGHESPGDVISQFDPATRTGFHLGLYTHGGVTNAQPNDRQLHFGIDQGRIEPSFTDHGRLGAAVYIFSLCVHAGRLYAGTCEAGPSAGHVFRYEGKQQWADMGSPDRANAISALAVHDGSLYVASSKYRLAGSSLAESTNPAFGGKIFRLGPNDEWIACGSLSPETEAVGSLISFRGHLYAGSLYKPAGFSRYDGADRWTPLPTPDGKRIEAMTVFNDALYATSYDEGAVFRFDGQRWEHLGALPGSTQTYGFCVCRGSLFVSEWPQAHVCRWTETPERKWIFQGKLGTELESMPLLVYNGMMYGGTLPSAAVFRWDGAENWTTIGRVDLTPDVKYRRAWSMAVHQGRLFVGTLPSGRVWSIEAGRNATHDHPLPTGWHHLAAVRDVDRLRLYVDGKAVAESATFNPADYDLSTSQPLRIGMGAQDHFDGAITDLRLYRGVLSADEIRRLAAMK